MTDERGRGKEMKDEWDRNGGGVGMGRKGREQVFLCLRAGVLLLC